MFNKINFSKKNTIFIMLIYKVISVLANVSIGLWLINYLGPSLQGKLIYNVNLVSILSFMVALGVGSHIAKEYIHDRSRFYSLIINSVKLRLIGFIVLSIVCLISAIFSDSYSVSIISVMLLSKLLFAVNVFQYIFEADGKLGVFTLFNIIIILLVNTFKILCILCGYGIETIVFYFVIEQSLLLFFSVYYYQYILKEKNNEKSELWKLFKKVLPLCMSTLVVYVFTQIDIFVIGFLLGDYSVGIYSAALQMVTPFYFFSGVVVPIFYKNLAELSHENVLFFELVKKLSSILIYGAALIIIIFNIFGIYIFEILFSKEFTDSFAVSQILFFALPFVYLGSLTGKVLILKNRYYLELKKTVVAAIFNLVFNFFLVNKFGVNGAAVSTLISYAIANYLFIYIFKDCIHLRVAINSSLLPRGFLR